MSLILQGDRNGRGCNGFSRMVRRVIAYTY